MPAELYGPFGALVALGAAVAALWRIVMAYIADLRTTRDRALAGWESQVAATRELADAIETRDRADAERRRLADR